MLIAGTLLGGGEWAQAKTANGPYYAPPAWARKMPVNARFVLLKNWNFEAVLDRETGLVWERSPVPAPEEPELQQWVSARYVCADKVIGDRKGWRLPSFAELSSLLDPSVPAPGPTIKLDHPFLGIQSAIYWSSSTDVQFPTLAWAVNFQDGTVFSNGKGNLANVWCVRGATSVDAY